MTNTQNNKNALVELQIIQLELANDRDYHFRHTVDQWFAYTNGYVTSSGKENTGRIEGNEYVSDEYLELIENKPWDTKGNPPKSKYIVKKEHVVPLKVIRDGLMKLKSKSLLDIEEYLTENVIFATISKSEDQKLIDAGVNDKMPGEFYDPTHELFGDKWARYKVAGIEVKKM